MILAVDVGNTRIKWGMHDGNSWLSQGWIETSDVAGLGDVWRGLIAPDRIVASNVAGPQVAMQIEEACKGWSAKMQWVVSVENQCGVSNGYEIPAQLGSDRWAALIAARAIAPEGCVVVNAGTAMTVDALTADGVFMGGLIVPGVATMLRALSERTAAIEEGGGHYKDIPKNTPDAVYSGALSAMVGAVWHMNALLAGEIRRAPTCLLSGGDAQLLLPLLSGKTRMVDNLVLDGLIRIALA
ncbi:pantothenate kinase [Sulfuricella denitrificans skB26]|uniref:Type III pantothenate kinase n=1 Tax=Sulfuricella denitrificans (strain DSM 22764 / NBRC 105220 / skB26) TaxID=1163617 RepID=S6AN99_SULDS|nr:type III pantothenate kinase [Sulfuricella denitrificans]BAN36314.1 pantothenate kinase [Sulfuricella denitrificans skB26]